jgi:hypothetical protein
LNTQTFEKDIAIGCSACKVTTLNLSISQQSPAGVANIVSAVQKDPTIDWVMLVSPPTWGGLPSTLAGAGVNKVKIVGTNCGSQALTNPKRSDPRFGGKGPASLGMGWV